MVRGTVRLAGDPVGRTLRRILILAAVAATAAVAVVLVNQTAQLVELVGRLHPVAGQVLLWALVILWVTVVLVPVALFLRLPSSLVAPASRESPAYEAFLEGLRRRLARNPRLDDPALETEEQIEAALGTLDEEADRIIGRTGRRVFLSTAVSQNGALDVLLVLGLQSRLVWDVAHVYHQRPSLRDMAWLYANVMTTALVAGELEDLDLAEQLQPVVQGVLGSAAGSVPGLQAVSSVFMSSVMSGTANAFLTLRVGIVARDLCGTLVRPGRRELRHGAFAEAGKMLGSIAASGARQLATALVKASGKTVTGAVTGLGDRVRNAGGSMVERFRRRTDEDG